MVPGVPLARLAALGLAGQAFLLTIAWLLPIASEYELMSDTISELALGRYGYLMTLALAVAGLGTVALAFVLRRVTDGLPGSLVGSALVAVYGAGAITAAWFPTEPVRTAADAWSQGTAGTIHLWAFLISAPAMIVGMFVLTRAFASAPDLRPRPRLVRLLPGSALALLFVQGSGPRAGLMQRLLVTAIALWLIAVAWRARRLALPASAPEGPPLRTGAGRGTRRARRERVTRSAAVPHREPA